jgi:hypothetical protein
MILEALGDFEKRMRGAILQVYIVYWNSQFYRWLARDSELGVPLKI